jgi:hypothetical protein
MGNTTDYVGGASATVDTHLPTTSGLEVRERAVTRLGVRGELCPQPGQSVLRQQTPTFMGGAYFGGIEMVASVATDIRIAPNAKPRTGSHAVSSTG